MSQWGRTPPGSKRRSESMVIDHPEGFPLPLPQQLHPSQSPHDSSSRQSSFDASFSFSDDSQSKFTSRARATPEIVPTLSTVPLQSSSASFTLPPLPNSGPIAYTLPPISPQSSRSLQLNNLSHGQQVNDSTNQTLQRENTSLAVAYSSAQARIADLEEEGCAAKTQTTKLMKDQQRLRAKIDVLEAEIDELQNHIESTQQHTTAKDAQYSQILDLSTKLQNRKATDTQWHKVQQEQWACEKQNMERMISMLKSEVESLHRDKLRSSAAPQPQDSGLPDRSAMTDQASLKVRSGVTTLDTMSMMQQDYAQIMDYAEKLGDIGKTIQTHVQNIGASTRK
ncbi:hypothetical protein ACLMJK_006590 [Lecanora helva]